MRDWKKIISMPEGKTLEFKRGLSSMPPIVKTIVAFANTAGGTLVIGKDDQGKILGVEDVFEAEEKLANVISDSIFPLLIPDIEVISMEGKSLLVICIAHWPGPFYIKSKGPKDGVFILIGSSNRAAGVEWLDALEQVKAKVSFDQRPCLEASEMALDQRLMKEAFQKIGKSVDTNKLLTLGVLVPYAGKRIPSNGGVVLFGQQSSLERLFPSTTVRCARFAGTEKVDFLD